MAASVYGGDSQVTTNPYVRPVGKRNELDPREVAAGRLVRPYRGPLSAPEGNKEFGVDLGKP
jgi:hypothetical protein